MTWLEFLTYHTSGEDGRPIYLEAQQWLREEWSFERVLKEWYVGNDILWAAEGIGVITHEQAVRIAAACVNGVAYYARDIEYVTDAVWQGDMTAAAFCAACVMGNVEPEEDDAIVDPSAMKAVFASGRLLSGIMHNAMYHAVQAPVIEARAAWAQALKEYIKLQSVKESDFAEILKAKAVVLELEAAIPRVEAREHLHQADFVRWALGVGS